MVMDCVLLFMSLHFPGELQRQIRDTHPSSAPPFQGDFIVTGRMNCGQVIGYKSVIFSRFYIEDPLSVIKRLLMIDDDVEVSGVEVKTVRCQESWI